MTTNKDTEMRKTLEKLPKEAPFIEEIEMWDQQYYVRVDGGQDIAERIMKTLKQSFVGDEYEVELLHDFDTNDVDVRIVASSLKEEEREVKERINKFLHNYDI